MTRLLVESGVIHLDHITRAPRQQAVRAAHPYERRCPLHGPEYERHEKARRMHELRRVLIATVGIVSAAIALVWAGAEIARSGWPL